MKSPGNYTIALGSAAACPASGKGWDYAYWHSSRRELVVTAASANHYRVLQPFLKLYAAHGTISTKRVPLIVFDLGLTSEQRAYVRGYASELLAFDFTSTPQPAWLRTPPTRGSRSC